MTITNQATRKFYQEDYEEAARIIFTNVELRSDEVTEKQVAWALEVERSSDTAADEISEIYCMLRLSD